VVPHPGKITGPPTPTHTDTLTHTHTHTLYIYIGFYGTIDVLHFKMLRALVAKAITGIDSSAIDASIAKIPVDHDALKTIAKASTGKNLYISYDHFNQASIAYKACCSSIGAPTNATADDEQISTARKLVSIFLSVQALTRSLKAGETRAVACKSILDKLFQVPPPLMLALRNEIGSTTTSAADIEATSLHQHDSDDEMMVDAVMKND
jgi:hypothetical protein